MTGETRRALTAAAIGLLTSTTTAPIITWASGYGSQGVRTGFVAMVIYWLTFLAALEILNNNAKEK